MRKIQTLLMLGGISLSSSMVFGLVSAKLFCNEWPCEESGLFVLFAFFAFASFVFALISFGNALYRYLDED